LDRRGLSPARGSCGERPPVSRTRHRWQVRLAYIDESYDRRRFLLAVVLVRPECVPTICASLDDEVEWAYRTFDIPRETELHAQQVLQGKGVWSRLRSDVRVRLRVAERVLDSLASCDPRVLVFSYTKADEDGRTLNAARAYRECLDMAIKTLERLAGSTWDHVLIIADEVSSADDYRDHVLRWRRDGSSRDGHSGK
jgi:hypothetical protein